MLRPSSSLLLRRGGGRRRPLMPPAPPSLGSLDAAAAAATATGTVRPLASFGGGRRRWGRCCDGSGSNHSGGGGFNLKCQRQQGPPVGGRRGLSTDATRSAAAPAAGSGDGQGPMAAYMRLVEGGRIERNVQQLQAVRRLQDVYEGVVAFAANPEKYTQTSYRFVDFGIQKETVVCPPKGLYLHGGVGTGKTFLMDLFYEQAPVKRKRRVHFNQFMLEVHERLHRLRQQGHRVQDPLALVIEDLHRQAWLLCFDEFQVTDVADAMVLKRLFSGLLAKGTVVIATSNRPPDDLYLHGLQRDLFLPFIALLKETHSVHDINSPTDYRLVHRGYGLAADAIFVHNSQKGKNETEKDEEDEARYGFNEALKHVTKGQGLTTLALPLSSDGGRRLYCPKVALSTRTVLFTFQELCGQALGPADYIALARTFATVFLADVPRMTLNDANRLRRFITLVDCLYEHRAQLVLLAEAPPAELFDAKGNRDSQQDEVFAFDRTVSRLMEMQGADYRRHHGSHRAEAADGAALLAKALKASGVLPSPAAVEDSKKGGGKQEGGNTAAGAAAVAWWDAPEGAVWRFYDLDGAGAWGEAKLRAFLEDFAEATLKRRGDVIPPSLVKELLPSVASPEAFEALMNEGQGAAVVLGALRQQGGQGGK